MDSFQQPAFAFKMPTNDYNPNEQPTDGEEYLQKMAYERAKCPAVVVKPFKIKSTTRNDSQSNASLTVWDQYNEVRKIISIYLLLKPNK